MEWKTIDTAPKDGTEILCYPSDESSVCIVEWNPDRNGGSWVDPCEGYYTFKPTHWMPLPKAPEEE